MTDEDRPDAVAQHAIRTALNFVKNETANDAAITDYRAVSEEDAARIQKATGLDVTGYVYALSAYAVRHIIKKHGDERERLRGQEPVLYDDFLLLNDIVSIPDGIENATTTKQGRDTMRLTGTVGGVNFTLLLEVQKGRKRLMLVTMHKKAGRSVGSPRL